MIGSSSVAVLTGDIVDSSGLERVAEQPVSVLLDNAGNRVDQGFQNRVHGTIDVFRGDSWQMVVNEPAIAIRVGIYFRALLRANYGIDSRISIGFGGVDFLPLKNISTGTGEAFTLSGQGLEACLKPTRMNLSFPPGTQNLVGKGLIVITQLLDLQLRRWTQGQSQAVAGALLNLTQAEIAANWQPEPISQQAVSQHLENAGWTQIKNSLLYLERTIPAVLA
mgnify:CR=1 FL=1